MEAVRRQEERSRSSGRGARCARAGALACAGVGPVRNAREWIGEGGELSAAEVRRRAENLDVVTIQWEGDLPNGDNAKAIALALANAGDF